jgi:hypothetical protein
MGHGAWVIVLITDQLKATPVLCRDSSCAERQEYSQRSPTGRNTPSRCWGKCLAPFTSIHQYIIIIIIVMIIRASNSSVESCFSILQSEQTTSSLHLLFNGFSLRRPKQSSHKQLFFSVGMWPYPGLAAFFRMQKRPALNACLSSHQSSLIRSSNIESDSRVSE